MRTLLIMLAGLAASVANAEDPLFKYGERVCIKFDPGFVKTDHALRFWNGVCGRITNISDEKLSECEGHFYRIIFNDVPEEHTVLNICAKFLIRW